MSITIASGMRLTPARLNALFPVVVRKNADESRASTTTLTADSALLLPNLVANAVYQVVLVALIRSAASGATPGMKTDFTLPAGASMAAGTFLYTLPAVNYATTGANGSVLGISLPAVAGPFRVDALLVMGGAAGTLAFRWAQNTSSATASVVATGSWLRAERID